MRRIISTALAAMWIAAPAGALDSSLGNLVVTPVATGFEEPWAVGFLPGGAVLVTERAGRLSLLRDGDRVEVSGVPEVAELGQGGLLDVMVPRDFAESGEIFLSFAKPQGRSAGTALVKAKLDVAGAALAVSNCQFARPSRAISSRISGAMASTRLIAISPPMSLTSGFSRRVCSRTAPA